jgi:hypothetical protein
MHPTMAMTDGVHKTILLNRFHLPWAYSSNSCFKMVSRQPHVPAGSSLWWSPKVQKHEALLATPCGVLRALRFYASGWWATSRMFVRDLHVAEFLAFKSMCDACNILWGFVCAEVLCFRMVSHHLQFLAESRNKTCPRPSHRLACSICSWTAELISNYCSHVCRWFLTNACVDCLEMDMEYEEQPVA